MNKERPNYIIKRKVIEQHITNIKTYREDGTFLSERYCVIYSQQKARVSKSCQTFEEAKQIKDMVEENIRKATLNKTLSEELKESIVEYPENLLKVLGITEDKYINYYDDILPNFEENYKNLISERERQVVDLYFKEYLTLEKVGNRLNITRERVRQILNKALRKINARKNLLTQSKEKLELISAEERERMIAEIRESMTIEVALEVLKNANYKKLKADTPIEDLEFSVRTYNCLIRYGIENVKQLMKLSIEDLMKVRNLGRKSLREIVVKMRNDFDFEFEKNANEDENEIY